MDDALVFYQSRTGIGEIYSVLLDNAGIVEFGLLHPRYTGWRSDWKRILFCGSDLLVFYAPGAGHAEIYSGGISGQLSLRTSYSDWRTSWQKILRVALPGVAPAAASDCLLFYDMLAGQGQISQLNSDGSLSLLQTFDGWRRSWTNIVSWTNTMNIVTEIDTSTAVLFYDRAAGQGEIYTLDGKGQLGAPAHSYTGWRTSWTEIVAIGSGAVVFYERPTGFVALYAIDNQDHGLRYLNSYPSFGTSWTHLVPVSLNLGTGLLFYDQTSGAAALYQVDILTGTLSQYATADTQWQPGWDELATTASAFTGPVKIHIS